MEAKAVSVTRDGASDGWESPRGWRAQVAADGSTRLVVYVPTAELAHRHLALVGALGDKVSIRYVKLTDRETGQLPKPETWVAMDLPGVRVRIGMEAAPALLWEDGRHQFWARGAFGEQVVLDELGVLYCYPDDPAFRDALDGLPETAALGLDARDFVKVRFVAEADVQERDLMERLGLRKWGVA